MTTLRVLLAGLLVGLAFSALPAQTGNAGQPTTLTLLVPADAQVEFDGQVMTTGGETRYYSTPPLQPGRSYAYQARITSDGRTITRQLRFRVGGDNTFDFRSAFSSRAALTEEDARDLATEAYVFGYPLVTMELTRRVMTNVAEPKGNRAPMGQFANLRTYPDATFRDVTAPNADTLYSSAWLDLTKEPYVLGLPDEGNRFYLMPMLDGWTDVFRSPGTRTSGTMAQTYLLTGPKWTGEVPDGVTRLKAPTNIVWILGRTYCTGSPEDYKAVHAIQDKYKLVPLSAYGKDADYVPAKGSVDPAIDTKTPVRDQVNRLDARAFFTLLAKLMKDNPPAPEDEPMVKRLARIGLVPGEEFDASKLDPVIARGMEQAVKPGLEQIVGHLKQAGKILNGWVYPVPGGLYGTNYLQRAAIAYYGLGCNRTDDAVYPTAEVDSDGKPLDGANRYTITFAKGQMPPVEGFWSLTMYDADYFFVANALNRYTVSARDKLQENADGSVTLYVQHESPGKDKEANWLPAPKGKFVLMMRLYWPREKSPSILDGTWQPPAVKKAS